MNEPTPTPKPPAPGSRMAAMRRAIANKPAPTPTPPPAPIATVTAPPKTKKEKKPPKPKKEKGPAFTPPKPRYRGRYPNGTKLTITWDAERMIWDGYFETTFREKQYHCKRSCCGIHDLLQRMWMVWVDWLTANFPDELEKMIPCQQITRKIHFKSKKAQRALMAEETAAGLSQIHESTMIPGGVTQSV